MNKLALLQRIKELYVTENTNIIEYLSQFNNSSNTSIEDIMISYDFQAGTYMAGYLKNPEKKDKFLFRLVNIINSLPGRKQSIFEAGVGEGTSFFPLLQKLLPFLGGGWYRYFMVAH